MNALAIDPRNRIRNHDRYSTDHHTSNGGFRNFPVSPGRWLPAGADRNPPTLKAASWLLGRVLRSVKGFDPTPVQPIDPAALRSPASRHFETYWLGHSTTLIRIDDQIILTDPVLGPRIGPAPVLGMPRLAGLPFGSLVDLPRVDTVLISHDHYDHLDQGTVLALEQNFRPWFFVPRGLRSLLESWGIARVCELDWWQHLQHGDLTFHCLPARHFSGRGLLDRDRTLWASWAITPPSRDIFRGRASIYFGGDSGYGPHFKEIRQVIGPIDLALLPIGAYLPRWFMQSTHMDPAEAIESYLDLDAQECLGIHWGTFDLADEAVHEPPLRLNELLDSRGLDRSRFHILPIGGSIQR